MTSEKKDTAYFYLTPEGGALAHRLARVHPGDLYPKENFKSNLIDAFSNYQNLVCIMATGIVVRILAPLIRHKTSDPAVVVLDQKGEYAISLLSGHLGGANDLAREMAWISGGSPVITTATDVADRISFDSFAKKHGMGIQNIAALRRISGALLDGGQVRLVTDRAFPELESEIASGALIPCPVSEADSLLSSGEAAPLPTVVIDEGCRFPERPSFPVMYLRPKTICAGIGCKRNMPFEPIRDALLATLKEEGIDPLSLSCIATIPLKADEPGIISTAEFFKVPLRVIDTEAIAALDGASLGIASSDFVESKTGVFSVSTASAYLASDKGTILRDKAKFKGITVALCRQAD